MARIDDLVSKVGDESLRTNLKSALSELKKRQRFGLVFEEHEPEASFLFGLPIQIGQIVQRRNELGGGQLYKVTAFTKSGKSARVEPVVGGEAQEVSTSDLLVVKRFGEPMFPALTPLRFVKRGPWDRPTHAIINGENFHALQLLIYLFKGRVDCIYIDPPFNTGARDWKYNNRYVDSTDSWRHSKWLSFMEKRLRLAKKLLRPDGVMIITIDVNEIHHLGMLLEQLFPNYLRYNVTIVNNPKGTGEANFARVDEEALYLVPDTGKDLIQGFPADYPVGPLQSRIESFDSTLNSGETGSIELGPQENSESAIEGDDQKWEYQLARRRGSNSYRHQRANLFYPIFIDEDRRQIVRTGKTIPLDEKPDFGRKNGLRPIWPIDDSGHDRCWRFGSETMQREIDSGNLVLGKFHSKTGTWTINVRRPRKLFKKPKTVWWSSSHDAGTFGTGVLRAFLGKPNLFPFPKSIYAVRDCLATVVRNRPNAVILDFFAGSGTTFHATCLLNAADGGERQCVLVTNNEVSQSAALDLSKRGLYRGDPKFESRGIFEEVTRPFCEAVVTGRRPDGHAVEGLHIRSEGGRPYAQGFEENVAFYRLDYLDPDEIDLGRQFRAVLPALWLAAGGIGEFEKIRETKDFMLPKGVPFGVLFQESKFNAFKRAVADRPDISNIWLVTDSEEAYAEMRGGLPPRLHISMLYRDYLRNFRINTDRTL